MNLLKLESSILQKNEAKKNIFLVLFFFRGDFVEGILSWNLLGILANELQITSKRADVKTFLAYVSYDFMTKK